MCTFKEKIENKTQFTGYKVAIKDLDTGKYYSPITGVEYKPGLIEQPKVKITYFRFENILYTNAYNHNKRYYGMTAVYQDLQGALAGTFTTIKRRLPLEENFPVKNIKVVILKMTIQKTKNLNCYLGIYYAEESCHSVYIGPKIRSMKEIDLEIN